ncbi:MAG: glycoside hydrolase family 18 protein [Chitinophagaceae bacterium]|nr:MAG: glycoside hydrolase family 18 protein [Chitinophagaceae bacterium]
MKNLLIYLVIPLMLLSACTSEKKDADKSTTGIAVIAYYSGNNSLIDNYDIKKLTHIIFSFCHLKGNRLSVDNASDSATIKKLVSLKSKNPQLKVMLSLGGWGGCEFCSQVFETVGGRKEFAQSTKELTEYFKTDGIDLDWEYPVIEGYPGHRFIPEDKANFTSLMKELRDALGKEAIISFAAGGFEDFLKKSVEWDKVMPAVDMVNIMSYDLVSGFSTMTGHHTPLYSSAQQKESADKAVRYLDSIGVPKNKMVIGAAFYGRVWENVQPVNNGLYQQGKFKSFIPYRLSSTLLSTDSGYVFFRDSITKAAYAYNVSKNLFATFDDTASIRLKTQYTISQGLKGIMFWELTLDKQTGGLLDVIEENKKNHH